MLDRSRCPGRDVHAHKGLGPAGLAKSTYAHIHVRARAREPWACLFVCLLWSFDAPRPVVLCCTSRTGGVHFRSVTWPAGWTVHENPSPGADLPLRWILAGGQKAVPPGAACRLPRVPENARVGLPSSPGPPVAGYRTSPPTGPLTAPQEGAVKVPGNQGSG